MKRILSIFIFLLLCSQANAMNVVMMSGAGTITEGVAGLAIDDDSSAYASGGGTSLTWSHTVSGSDRVLFVGCANRAAQPTGVTYNGDAMTSVFTDDRVGTYFVSGWVLINPDTGTHDIVVSYSGSTEERGGYGLSFTGAHQTTAVGTPTTGDNYGTTSTIDVSAATGDIVVDILFHGAADEPSIGASQTQIHTATGASRYQKGSYESGASTTTMSWTHETSHWAQGGVAIKPK